MPDIILSHLRINVNPFPFAGIIFLRQQEFTFSKILCAVFLLMTQNRTSILPCSKAIKHIQTDLDTEFHKKAYRQIKMHIEQCPNCFYYLDSLKKVIYFYKRLPDLRPDIKSHKKLQMIINLVMEHKLYK